MRETLYSPPDGEGPTVVVYGICNGCNHLRQKHSYGCHHPQIESGRFLAYDHLDIPTPLWCPIIQPTRKEWERRLKGEGT